MIKEIRETPPFIHFGFNKQSKTAFVGDDIIVWQDFIYSKQVYNLSNMDISASGGQIVEKDFNKIIIRFTSSGLKTIKIELERNEKMQSNTLNINIV